MYEKVEHFKMYYTEKYGIEYNDSIGDVVDGLAFGDFILVWTKHKTIIDVLEICTHEYAHNNLDMKD
jgi:uncharacterized protein YjaZ